MSCFFSDSQCTYHSTASSSAGGLRWVLSMLQHLAHSTNRPIAADEKKKRLRYILVVITPVGTISGKPLKLLPPDVIF